MADAVYSQLETLCETIERTNSSVHIDKIKEAFEFAFAAHGEQKRKDGTPFITHPLAAAQIVAEMGLDEESVISAILHDCIEDTPVSHEDIAKKFGTNVAEIVEGVTKLTRVTYTSKEEQQMENIRKMLMAMAKDIRVIIIKIADRLHNMRTMEYQSAEKQREKSLETMEIYAPIAYRLGMQKFKNELEDLAIPYLDPVGVREIRAELSMRGEEYTQFFNDTQKSIGDRLTAIGVSCKVSGRIKHLYSIYRKMYAQNKQFSEVMDLYAFRVIVDDIADCYNVLGYIHEMFRPIPGYFKDYISTPKPNGYQSIHTTVIGSEGVPFEVQIRTWDMHHTAEYGIAAHWKYKEGISGHEPGEEKFAWIRRLLEAQQDTEAQDFFHTIRIDLFSDEVFVFTPQGDVVNLPAGATPIDFAYSIHSQIGNKMVGAKVNGRIVPFSHKLQNGDIVQVLTSNASKGPSRDWLNIVQSGEARSKIRQWFKKEKREDNISQGKMMFEVELRRVGIASELPSHPDIFQQSVRKLSFTSEDDMFAAIGYGGISAQKVVNRISDDLRQAEKNARKEMTIAAENKNERPVHGIIVEGLDNCLVKFSRCCAPVPGDEVIGYITRGYGISVHRADCPNYIKAMADETEKARWINVHWGETTDETYQTAITILARDRDGLVMDVATVLNSLKVKVTALNARDTGDEGALIHITLKVKDRAELGNAMSKLLALNSVREVSRSGI